MSANVTDVTLEYPTETVGLMSGSTSPPASANDPFYHFKTSLSEKIDVLDNAAVKFLGMVRTTDTTTNPEYPSGKKRLKKLTKVCESTLKVSGRRGAAVV